MFRNELDGLTDSHRTTARGCRAGARRKHHDRSPVQFGILSELLSFSQRQAVFPVSDSRDGMESGLM